ncbi:sn-glycerol-3-phosphate ABC transporter ATP-binding protein UgpC [Chelativorans sp. AA-79]|uniref:ABC transporter ATP-binding protein n=1 Tax=Chelativorans sp. AA-79 TaxID=3028735 RepID=UPI0023F8BB03|nr:sn-glycerol-3-phosphate ABC transporter ATP-binding protein UgpC [Chelativorans sp. AA-79]WEX12251.1 sn-glycerol-3-phosphate ABC transporter ATP-binding protein UgpC [Chelativorans sp. AA-79]
MAQVELRSVRKSFGAVGVIHGVDLTIGNGEFVALVGPSGCGKSTLLRMLAGLEAISSGEIAIDGKVVNSVAPKDRDIAMVFQSYALYPNMSVEENMSFALRLSGESGSVIRERVDSAASTLGLSEYLDRQPKALSGGQRQRVAMGRAIVRKPQVFLFDEPLSNLDAKLRVKMRTEIKQLHQSLKTTTVYVTHDQVEAMTMADRIVVLRDGRIEQVGRPLELYDRPANEFVAGFIGSPSMNFIAATKHGSSLRAGALDVDCPGLQIDDGTLVTLGVRPEDIVVHDDGAEFEVAVVEPTGPETFIVLNGADCELLASFRERRDFSVGDVLRLAVRPGRLHAFDRTSGQRLN